MRRSLTLSRRYAAKPLLAAATLALLTGCAHNGDFLSSPLQSLSALLGGKSAQTQESGNAELAANPTTASAPAQRASAPATQVAAANAATSPKPAAPPKPAPPPIKDVGLFGNFEIGAGFGAQKANGFTGTIAGVTDGPAAARHFEEARINHERIYVVNRTTLEGEKFQTQFMGRRCGFNSRPHHKIKVTSPVAVKFTATAGSLYLHGKDVDFCSTSVSKKDQSDFMLELLAGDYDLHVNGDGAAYTLTLAEVPNATTNTDITIDGPGFKPVRATGIVLHDSYRPGPLARPHTVKVLKPTLIAAHARVQVPDIGEIKLSLQQGQEILWQNTGGTSSGDDGSVRGNLFYLAPGEEYQFHVSTTRHDMGWDGGNPGRPYELTLRDQTRVKMAPQHVQVDEKFKQFALESAYVPNPSGRNVCVRPGNNVEDTSRAGLYVHKLSISKPTMMHFRFVNTKYGNHSHDYLSFLVVRPDGQGNEFCSNVFRSGNEDKNGYGNLFLTPGEYEVYVGRTVHGPDKYPMLYTLQITARN